MALDGDTLTDFKGHMVTSSYDKSFLSNEITVHFYVFTYQVNELCFVFCASQHGFLGWQTCGVSQSVYPASI